jgi:Ser/Thr protein kinase RdoA (MazF antagonist)
MGRLLSRLDLALSSFDHPGSCYTLLWDMQHASKLRPLLPHIADSGLRRLCQQRLARFTEYTGPVIQELRKQVIYNDLNPSNLLVDSVDPRTIRGIIDFGDMVHTPLIVDVAVGAAYLCTDNPSSMSQVEQFVAGFNELQPLQDDEIDVLFELIMTRHVMTIVITHWRARQYPHNRDYILRNEPRARQTIRDLSGMQTDDVTRAFYSACRA